MNSVLEKLSKDTGLPVDIIRKTYNTYWRTIKSYIEDFPLKGNITEEEFKKYRTNINIPSLGKLYTDYEKIGKAKRQMEYVKKLRSKYENDKCEGSEADV
jgi:predicted transcriptional regulator